MHHILQYFIQQRRLCLLLFVGNGAISLLSYLMQLFLGNALSKESQILDNLLSDLGGTMRMLLVPSRQSHACRKPIIGNVDTCKAAVAAVCINNLNHTDDS
ncbi:hypothetical protein CEXT_71571 [Caerostris extrusa]|uniref:Uncharacterized protein n=1 Tax=Caerostris extrusa TaxID=172846 RepID=A0AAV4V2A7_CAEEX|nr:hypothetical protein CEXT_71571 [Caerostris extrusa]